MIHVGSGSRSLNRACDANLKVLVTQERNVWALDDHIHIRNLATTSQTIFGLPPPQTKTGHDPRSVQWKQCRASTQLHWYSATTTTSPHKQTKGASPNILGRIVCSNTLLMPRLNDLFAKVADLVGLFARAYGFRPSLPYKYVTNCGSEVGFF